MDLYDSKILSHSSEFLQTKILTLIISSTALYLKHTQKHCVSTWACCHIISFLSNTFSSTKISRFNHINEMCGIILVPQKNQLYGIYTRPALNNRIQYYVDDDTEHSNKRSGPQMYSRGRETFYSVLNQDIYYELLV